jgi:hypothetical protein
MAENLEKIERLRRSLMIDVAHELRTPLTNIRGYLEALNDGVLPPAPETLSLLQDETLRLAELVEDVLALARADAASGRLEPTAVDLKAKWWKTPWRPLPPPLTKKHGDGQSRTRPASPVTIHADRNRLARVLRNLTDNASPLCTDGPEPRDHHGYSASGSGQGGLRQYGRRDIVFPMTCPISSNAFTGAKNRDPGVTAAPASACPSSRNWWRHMAVWYHADLTDGIIHIGFTLPLGRGPHRTLSAR